MAAVSVLMVALADEAGAEHRCGGKPVTISGSKRSQLIKGTNGADVIDGGGGSDRIFGRAGRDTICTEAGNDQIDGGRGRDRVFSGNGVDLIHGDLGSDKLFTGAGNDSILGGPGGEQIRAGDGDDLLYGGLQDDTLLGESGNDLIVGGQGSDNLFGADGDDWLRGDSERDFFDGGPGNDWGSFATATPPATHSIDDGGIRVGIGPNGNYAVGDEGREELASLENVLGSAFYDFIGVNPQWGVKRIRGIANRRDDCTGAEVTECGSDPRLGSEAIAFAESAGRESGLYILGNGAADSWQIEANQTSFTIHSQSPLAAGPGCLAAAGAVSCTLPAPVGYLVAFGDAGNDTIALSGVAGETALVKLDGGMGDDRVSGGPGDEILIAGGSVALPGLHPELNRDVLDGAGGDDVLVSGPGSDVLQGGPGADQLVAQDPCGGHVFDGGPGGPDIAGFNPVGAPDAWVLGPGAEGITAQIGGSVTRNIGGCVPSRVLASNEVLEGTPKADLLIGSAGPDALILGGLGHDVIRGRGGADHLRGEQGSDTLFGGGGRDVLEARDHRRDRLLDCGADGGRSVQDSKDPPARHCASPSHR